MASRQGILSAHKLIVALYSLSSGQQNQLAEAATIWQSQLTDVADEDLQQRIKACAATEPRKAPTLAQLMTVGGAPKAAPSATDGCSACKGSGTRQVCRHTSAGEMQELAARCPCQAGDRRKGQGMLLLGDLVTRWQNATDTLDGPWADPEPQHRLPPSARPALLARAQARLAGVQREVPAATPGHTGAAGGLW